MIGAIAVEFVFLDVDDDALSDSDVIVTILSWNAKHTQIKIQHQLNTIVLDYQIKDYSIIGMK